MVAGVRATVLRINGVNLFVALAPHIVVGNPTRSHELSAGEAMEAPSKRQAKRKIAISWGVSHRYRLNPSADIQARQRVERFQSREPREIFGINESRLKRRRRSSFWHNESRQDFRDFACGK